jgi:hypothetical protein
VQRLHVTDSEGIKKPHTKVNKREASNRNRILVIYCFSALALVKVAFPRANGLHFSEEVQELWCAGPYNSTYDVPPDIHQHRSK